MICHAKWPTQLYSSLLYMPTRSHAVTRYANMWLAVILLRNPCCTSSRWLANSVCLSLLHILWLHLIPNPLPRTIVKGRQNTELFDHVFFFFQERDYFYHMNQVRRVIWHIVHQTGLFSTASFGTAAKQITHWKGNILSVDQLAECGIPSSQLVTNRGRSVNSTSSRRGSGCLHNANWMPSYVPYHPIPFYTHSTVLP